MSSTQIRETHLREATNVPVGDDIVISGIAGRFPESDNVKHLQENLMSKRDLLTEDDRRWKADHYPEIPKKFGKISNIEKFDATFFGIHQKQAHSMDPIGRMILEHSFEAILDAGVNPKSLRGSKTGVFVGGICSESERDDKLSANGFGLIKRSSAMLANRISYCLDLKGPSCTVDSACSSTLYALHFASRAINEGSCDAALVATGNLCLHPITTLEYYKLGVLSKDGLCKTFDGAADGYSRSEAACVLFLQKSKQANRIYSRLVHMKTDCDGFKEESITFSSSRTKAQLLDDFYQECAVPVCSVRYVEAHGTGTKVGDFGEVSAIDQVMCKNRPEGYPILIGSIKSNLGHCEYASGLVAIAKVIIAMESGLIPPNLHYQQCRRELAGIAEGRIRVVDRVTPWEGGYAGVNSFGFGGANAHALLKSHDTEKVNGGAPDDNLPRLVGVSGRTKDAVDHILSELEKSAVDVEYVALLHSIHSDEISGHMYRGYTILPPHGVSKSPVRAIEKAPRDKIPVWFAFSGMGSQCVGMGEALLRLPVFAKAIDKCDAVMKPLGIDIRHVITNKNEATFDDVLNSFVGITAVQIGMVDVLFSIGIKPDNIIGHSLGESGCAYADGSMTAEQTILAAYYRGLISLQTKIIYGSMAAVGLGYAKLREMCPSDIDVACHNSADNATISGPADSVNKFVTEMKAKDIFAKEVSSGNIPYHSRYISTLGPKLLAHLQKVIPDPKPRSEKWVSTSLPMDKWDTELARYSSAEYHTNNLISPVLFEETLTLIPKNAIVIEIAPHGLLQSILKRSLGSGVTNIPLALRGHPDNVQVLLQAVGRMFNAGLQPQLCNLYPAVQFPVSRTTPMISPLIKWEHSQDWFVTSYKQQKKMSAGERIVKISVSDKEYASLAGHIIAGKNLVPTTSFLTLIWETLAMMHGKMYTGLPVVFQDIKFIRAATIPKDGHVELTLMIHKGTGRFEVVDGDTAVATGYVRTTEQPAKEKSNPRSLPYDEEEPLTAGDVYKELRLRGYVYTGIFRSITRASATGSRSHILWQNDWTAFMDNMLHVVLLGIDTRELLVPVAIEKLVIDTAAHFNQIESEETRNEFEAVHSKSRNVISCGGVQISGVTFNSILIEKDSQKPVIEEYTFVPSIDGANVSLRDMARLSSHIAIENQKDCKIKTFELVGDENEVSPDDLLSPWISQSAQDLPLIQADVIVLKNRNDVKLEGLADNITVIDNKEAGMNSDAILVMGRRLLIDTRIDNLNLLLNKLKPGGFVLTREDTVKDINNIAQSKGFHLILIKKHEDKFFVLLRKQESVEREAIVINVSNENFDWVDVMRRTMTEALENKMIDNTRIYFVAQGHYDNGLLGFFNCLRMEVGGESCRCIFIQDPKAPPFSIKNSLYAEQVRKDLSMNVLREHGVWGTYRHLPLGPVKPKAVQHKYIKQLIRGDLSSLEWVEGPLDPQLNKNKLIHIVYASLNFKDIMLASGNLRIETGPGTRLIRDHIFGIEFSGVDNSGNKVMCYTNSQGLSNLWAADKSWIFDIPHNWSLEDAATVPCAYATCIYALYIKGRMKKSDKVLIHAGSGGVGQAAINLALSEGCEIFTTVGTPEKRQFIRERFPQISDDHIGNSRDTSFVDMIGNLTGEHGVDIVLNSLSEDKLLASMKCLAACGRFLEIGRFDLAANNPLGMKCFLREISFHGVSLDRMFGGSSKIKSEVQKLMDKYLKNGVIKPLTRTVFAENQVEEAFRYMAVGRHVGKILMKVGNEENPMSSSSLALPQYYCLQNRSYVILGGLGGFGLELADWLVLRGAKNLVLTSRKGVTNGYQRMRIDLWKSYGVNVAVVSGKDASSYQDCQFILDTATNLARIDGVFNLAVALCDATWENQTPHTFEESFKPKAWATKNLDVLTRQLCPELRHFVDFSSVSCGKGNIGQSNYGMANSVMERICERRVSEGLPGLAIQWGAIGDVGTLADGQVDNEEVVIRGTAQQRISSCLQELDGFFHRGRAVVSSIVIAEGSVRKAAPLNIVQTVQNIMGLKDLEEVGDNISLAALGTDSILSVEIQQTLEREFKIHLTGVQIHALTFAKLREMDRGSQGSKEMIEHENFDFENVLSIGIRGIMPFFVNADITQEKLKKLDTKQDTDRIEVFFIPGFVGMASAFSELAPKIRSPATCLQFGIDVSNFDSLHSIAENYLPYVLEKYENHRNFEIVGYCIGCSVAIELVRRLEAQGLTGKLVFIDGSPLHSRALIMNELQIPNSEFLQNTCLSAMINTLTPLDYDQFAARLENCNSWQEKVQASIEICSFSKCNLSPENCQILCDAIYKRLSWVFNYDTSQLQPINSPITLLRPTIRSFKTDAEDYDLSKITTGPIEIHYLNGDHYTMMHDEKAALIINGDLPSDQKPAPIMDEVKNSRTI